MDTKQPNVLVVESDDSVASQYCTDLAALGFKAWHVTDCAHGISALDESSVDAVLVCHPSEHKAAFEVVSFVASQAEPIPAVVVVDSSHEHVAVEMLKSGAADYVVVDSEEPKIVLIAQALRSAIRQYALVCENRNLQHYTHEAHLMFGSLLQKSDDACFVWQRREDGEIILNELNAAAARLAGGKRQVLLGASPSALGFGDDAVAVGVQDVMDGGCHQWRHELVVNADAAEPSRLSLRCVRLGPDDAMLTVRDVTDEKRIERELCEWKDRCERLTGVLADYVFTVRVESGQPAQTVHSSACLAVTGYTSQEFANDPYLWIDMVIEDDRELVRQHATNVLLGRGVHPIEHRIRHKDGTIRWVSNTPLPHYDEEGQLISYDGLVQDITGRKEIEEAQRRNEELFRTLSGFSSDFIFWNSPDGQLRYVSPACLKITGYSAEQIREDPAIMDRIVYEDDRGLWHHHRQCALSGGAPEAMEFRIMTRNGDVRWVSHTCRPVHDEHGRFLGVRGSNRDITDLKNTEQQLKDYACEIVEKNSALEEQQRQLKAQQDDLIRTNTKMEKLAAQLSQANTELNILVRIDPLTQLLNRRAWQENADNEQQRAERTGEGYCIVMLDVDYFKLYNDSCGHQAGDECLTGVAACLAGTCRSIDHVGRYGGEEFIVLCPETSREQAEVMGHRIRQAIWEMNREHPDSATADRVTVSIGVAESNGEPLEQIIKRADEALYEAKHTGRDRVVCDADLAKKKAKAQDAPMPI